MIRTGTTANYAYVEDYLEFDRAVPFREGNHYYESGLQKADGSTNKGRFGLSVRGLDDGSRADPSATGVRHGDQESYNNTGAISGFRIINGGGRAEAQAAHIPPVKVLGLDSPRLS